MSSGGQGLGGLVDPPRYSAARRYAGGIAIDGTAAAVAAVIKLGAGADYLAGSVLTHVKTASFDGGAGLDHLQEQTFVADPIVIVSFEDFT